MEDRIRKFMEYKGISPSELADAIGVQRSNVTHVLKARNKPSFQFIEKLLQIYPEINAKWLLLGEGIMIEGVAKSRTLFDPIPEPAIKPLIQESFDNPNETKRSLDPDIVKDLPSPEPKENTLSTPEQEKKVIENELYDSFFGSEKSIERLIVFFKDQTFKVYNPSR
jgi:transcriptional regulator with XRE-family HTH domain